MSTCCLVCLNLSQDVAGEEPTDAIPAEDEDWIMDSVNRFDKLNKNGGEMYVYIKSYIIFIQSEPC